MELAIQDVVRQDAQLPFLHVLPATQDLVGAELELIGSERRETILRGVIDAVQDDYEYILIDCPPSLGLVTLNVLTAADAVIIPIQCEYYALEGISQLLNTIRVVQQNFNPDFQIEGVLLTMYDNRLNLSAPGGHRGEGVLRRQGLPDRHPAQRAPRRGAVVRQADPAL